MKITIPVLISELFEPQYYHITTKSSNFCIIGNINILKLGSLFSPAEELFTRQVFKRTYLTLRSTVIQHKLPRKLFAWDEGYDVFSGI